MIASTSCSSLTHGDGDPFRDVVGEAPQFADIVVQPYPSDHRAVVATVEVR